MPVERDFRKILMAEFEKRRLKNPAYSLGAYSRDLNLGAPTLVRVLNRQRSLSPKKAQLILENLEISSQLKEVFIAAVESEYSKSPLVQAQGLQKLEVLDQKSEYIPMDSSSFENISDWFYSALYLMANDQGIFPSASEIQKRLGISFQETEMALEKLMKNNLISQDPETGKWMQTTKKFTVSSKNPSQAVRHHHRQIFEKAAQSLEQVEIPNRHVGSFHFSLSVDQIPEFKERVEQFQMQLSQELSQKVKKKEKVYTLAVAFFPLEQKND